MADIRHRVGIDAPAARVYDALTTTEGLASWWTEDVRGDASLGGQLRFYFGSPEPGAVMEVVELVPGRRLAWRCVAGVEDWIGTDLTFDLASTPEETVLMFTHANWREPGEFMHNCSTKWAVHLIALKTSLEGGKATPHPHEAKISSWG